ncbi:MAG: low molecular weight protein-tyrosine-phosphatase [Gammaproteobacteria bacterium]
MNKVRVLMVCMGNICRSPTAHGVFQSVVDKAGHADWISVDSAGTHAYHVGSPPDSRAAETAERRGYYLRDQRARKVEVEDFGAFDYVLAMDRDNLRDLLAICPAEHRAKVRLFLDFQEDASVTEVPDPYYGGQNGFEYVLDLVERTSELLLEDIRRNHG